MVLVAAISSSACNGSKTDKTWLLTDVGVCSQRQDDHQGSDYGNWAGHGA